MWRPFSRRTWPLLAVAAVCLAGCGSDPKTGAFLVDVATGSTQRFAGDGSVLWPTTSNGPIVWTTSRARFYAEDGDEMRAVDLKDAAEDSFTVAGNHYAYVSLDEANSVSLTNGNVITGQLNRDGTQMLVRNGSRPWFTPDGRAVLTATGLNEPLRAGGDGPSEQLLSAPLSGAEPTPLRNAPSPTILASFGTIGFLFDVRRGNRSTVVLRRPNGATKTLALNRVWRSIDFAPAASRLIYASSSGGGIRMGTLTGGEPRSIARGNYLTAKWSPDGKRIAATTYDGRVLVMRPDGTDVSTVTTFKDQWPVNVAWSPDGRSLAVDVEEQPEPSD